ncbi:MAG TPA: hypothetical protein VKQ73_09230 [Stellaceae bacterium]|nr:hypothetical protein [Stellaceae bacterium]
MTKSEFRDLHKRIAARLRTLADEVATPAARERLLDQAEEHDRIAEREPDDAPSFAFLYH